MGDMSHQKQLPYNSGHQRTYFSQRSTAFNLSPSVLSSSTHLIDSFLGYFLPLITEFPPVFWTNQQAGKNMTSLAEVTISHTTDLNWGWITTKVTHTEPQQLSHDFLLCATASSSEMYCNFLRPKSSNDVQYFDFIYTLLNELQVWFF